MASRCSTQAAPGLSPLTDSRSNPIVALLPAKLNQSNSGGGTYRPLYKGGRWRTAVEIGSVRPIWALTPPPGVTSPPHVNPPARL